MENEKKYIITETQVNTLLLCLVNRSTIGVRNILNVLEEFKDINLKFEVLQLIEKIGVISGKAIRENITSNGEEFYIEENKLLEALEK